MMLTTCSQTDLAPNTSIADSGSLSINSTAPHCQSPQTSLNVAIEQFSAFGPFVTSTSPSCILSVTALPAVSTG
jgi:hypothetical protein